MFYKKKCKYTNKVFLYIFFTEICFKFEFLEFAKANALCVNVCFAAAVIV